MFNEPRDAKNEEAVKAKNLFNWSAGRAPKHPQAKGCSPQDITRLVQRSQSGYVLWRLLCLKVRRENSAEVSHSLSREGPAERWNVTAESSGSRKAGERLRGAPALLTGPRRPATQHTPTESTTTPYNTH